MKEKEDSNGNPVNRGDTNKKLAVSNKKPPF